MITENDIDQFAKEQERIEDGIDCLCCGTKFIPINREDQFCKKCLQKLFFELIEKMEAGIQSLRDEIPWRLENMKKTVESFNGISKPKKKPRSTNTEARR